MYPALCALWVVAAVPAVVLAAPAETVVIIDIAGNWERVTASGQPLTSSQQLQVRERIRFLAREPFVPGSLTLADSRGILYYSKPCKSRQSCVGVFEVPPVPTGTTAGPSILGRVFSPVSQFTLLLFGSNDKQLVNLLGSNTPQSGILRSAVLAFSGEVLDLCDSVAGMNRGTYGVKLISPSVLSGRVKFTGQLNWTGTCPATVTVRVGSLASGAYIIQTTDSAGVEDIAVLQLCLPERHRAAADEFRGLEVATRTWVEPGSRGYAIQDAARRRFLALYLLWASGQQQPSQPDGAGKHIP